jgi:hypothetical protein
MMTDQQFVQVCAAACEVLEGMNRPVLRAGGKEAYAAVAFYAALAWREHPVVQWYQGSVYASREQTDFFSRWYAWQQEQRHRIGIG